MTLVLLTTLFSSLLSLLFLRKLAITFHWLDMPTARKCHRGDVPLVGGVSTLCGVLVATLFAPNLLVLQNEYLFVCTLLVSLGVVDDKYDISAKSRLIVLVAVSLWMVLQQGVQLEYLGDLAANGAIYLGFVSIPFTIAAVIACITAFNMMDGLDGLLGLMASITLLALAFLFYDVGQIHYVFFVAAFILAMTPYIIFNLVVKDKYKVFMGDSGSYLVGFTVIWLMIFATQPQVTGQSMVAVMAPVTVLWIMALPVMDMALVMIKRIMKKRSPLIADNSHIHHILLALGYSPKQILFILGLLAIAFVSVGIWSHCMSIPEYFSLATFLLAFVSYSLFAILLEAKASKTM